MRGSAVRSVVTAPRYLLVLSDADPVANRVRDRLPMGRATGESVEGVPLRELVEGVWALRRPGLHIHDEHLDRRLPGTLREAGLPLVFPSIHRSERGVRCFTAHALGNVGAAEVGGEAGVLGVSAPRLMTAALRRLHEEGRRLSLPATFEATHHGPALELPSMFVEIGSADDAEPPGEAVAALAEVLLELSEDGRDRVAVGIGGGHYAPHFTDLALKRQWAFGHLLARHAVAGVERELLERALALTPGAEGYLFHSAADGSEESARGLTPRLSEGLAARRPAGGAVGAPTSAGRGNGPVAGT